MLEEPPMQPWVRYVSSVEEQVGPVFPTGQLPSAESTWMTLEGSYVSPFIALEA